MDFTNSGRSVIIQMYLRYLFYVKAVSGNVLNNTGSCLFLDRKERDQTCGRNCRRAWSAFFPDMACEMYFCPAADRSLSGEAEGGGAASALLNKMLC